MTIEEIGYGAGTQEFEQQPNLLRLLVGESLHTAESAAAIRNALPVGNEFGRHERRTHWPLRQSIVGRRRIGCFTTAIQMKKNRPGILLSVLCQPADAARLEIDSVSRNDDPGRAAVDGRAAQAAPPAAPSEYTLGTNRRRVGHSARRKTALLAGV